MDKLKKFYPSRYISKYLSILLLFSILISTASPLSAYQSFPFKLTARSAVLMDGETSRILLARSPYTKRPPASTTKLLTALVVMDHLSMNKVVTASAHAASMPRTNISLRRGEKFYVRDLLRALLIASANDAAVALAETTAGSERKFARLMNAKAHKLGAKHSNFVNAHGLPNNGQYTTAYGLALIARTASKNAFIFETMKTRYATIRSLRGRKVHLKNHNKMLWRDRRPLYGKTGWTRKSRHCFAGIIRHRGRDLFVVTMGGTKPWHDLKKMLDYAFGYAPANRIAKNNSILSENYIKKMQTVLKKKGYDPGPVDGKMGSKTLSAVMSFQKAHGLKPDGIVGQLTQKELEPYMQS